MIAFRLGYGVSLFAVVTTDASCGAVNAMHDSFTALGGMIPLINMQLGEVVVGGVGAGIYGFLLFAILAVFVSFLLIAIYVTLRYRWRFAVPILRTLLNDIPIAMGVYAVSGREVTAATVAAMLTILGYSLYDTVVVFDKVKENTRGITGQSMLTYSDAANLAVNQTLVRSINT